MIRLPEGLERQFLDDIHKVEEEKKMPYVTSAERFGIEKGRKEGRKEGLKKGRNEGRNEGRKEGHREGHREATVSTLRTVVQNAAKSGLSHEMIAAIADIEPSAVRKILNNESIEIPMHLLSSEVPSTPGDKGDA